MIKIEHARIFTQTRVSMKGHNKTDADAGGRYGTWRELFRGTSGQSVKLSMRKNRNVTITHDTKFEDTRIRQRSEKSDHCRKRVGERAPVIHFPAPLLSSRWRDTRDPGWSPPVVLQRSRHFSGFSATVPEWNPALPRSPELTTLSRPQPSVP